VDDLTASGANGRTAIREKLSLPSLDDFVSMVELMESLCPEKVWGSPHFFKRDMRKAFRQVPAHPESRVWGVFSVLNPEVNKVQLYRHLSLPFGARSAPLIFCAVSLILCQLAAHHLGIPIVAFVDDFFSPCPSSLSSHCFELFRWFVEDLLGFHLKTEKDEEPGPSGTLLGALVTLTSGGNGRFCLTKEKRQKYRSKVQQILDADYLSPGNAAKLAGALSFASSVTLARFGRPFLQPIYSVAAGRDLESASIRFDGEDRPKTGSPGLPHRLRQALIWWVQILESFPDKDFSWGRSHSRPIYDVFTDASAEDRWEGLGGVCFSESLSYAETFRVDNTPPSLEVYLPSKESQTVRIAQLEMLAVLIFVQLFGPRLTGSYVRFHTDNLSAM
jgi:hypothetical protein